MTIDNNAISGKVSRVFRSVLAATGKIILSLLAMTIWFLAGGVFHRSFDLFTRWNATTVNIASSIAGFLIMTASFVIIGYIIGERQNKKKLQ